MLKSKPAPCWSDQVEQPTTWGCRYRWCWMHCLHPIYQTCPGLDPSMVGVELARQAWKKKANLSVDSHALNATM